MAEAKANARACEVAPRDDERLSREHVDKAERHEADGDAGSRAAAKRPEFSEALTRRLAAHRTLALQVILSRNTADALAALAHSLALRVLGDVFARTGLALQITAQSQEGALTSAADDLKTGPAWLAAQTTRDGWLERLPADRSAWFGWLLELPQRPAGTARLLHVGDGQLVAVHRNGIGSNRAGAGRRPGHGGLVEADARRLPEPRVEGADRAGLKEAGHDLARDGVESMKKEVLVEAALARLAGTRWLPAPLRPPPA